MTTDETKERSFTVKMLRWCAPAIGLSLILAFVLSGNRSIGSAIGHTIGYNIGVSAMIIGAFCITDFFQNKTAARLFYVILAVGIMYMFYAPKIAALV